MVVSKTKKIIKWFAILERYMSNNHCILNSDIFRLRMWSLQALHALKSRWDTSIGNSFMWALQSPFWGRAFRTVRIHLQLTQFGRILPSPSYEHEFQLLARLPRRLMPLACKKETPIKQKGWVLWMNLGWRLLIDQYFKLQKAPKNYLITPRFVLRLFLLCSGLIQVFPTVDRTVAPVDENLTIFSVGFHASGLASVVKGISKPAIV